MGPLQLEVLSCLWTLEEAAVTGEPPSRPSSFWATTFEVWEAFNASRTTRQMATLSYATIWQILRRMQKRGALETRPKFRPGFEPPPQPANIPKGVKIIRDDLEDPLPPEPPEEPEGTKPPKAIRTWYYRSIMTRQQLLASRIREMRQELCHLLAHTNDPFRQVLQIVCCQEGSKRARKLLDHLSLPCFAKEPDAPLSSSV